MFEHSKIQFGDYLIEPSQNRVSDGSEVRILEPQAMNVLVYLIEHREKIVSSEELLESLWTGRVVLDSAIHARINQLRKAFNDSSKNPRYINTVVKRGYQAIAPVSFPQLKERERNSSISASLISGISAKAIGLLTATVVIVAFSYVTFFDTSESPERITDASVSNRVIAVLPFTNMSASEENGYFAAGIHEDLLTHLSENTDLPVISRTSVMRYAGHNESITEIGEELKADYVVEGSVRREGAEVRVTVQLIDAGTDQHLWASTYDKALADVFALQTEISREISAQLSIELTDQDTRLYFTDTDDALFTIRMLMREGSTDSLTAALHELRTIRNNDDQNAAVHSYIAKVLWDLSYINMSRSNVRDEIYLSLEKALALEPNRIDALLVRADIESAWHRNLNNAEAAYKKALSTDPNNPDVLMEYGTFLALGKGEYLAGITFLDRAVALNPYSGEAWANLANVYLVSGDLDQSYRTVLAGLEREPGNRALLRRQYGYYFYRGDRIQGIQKIMEFIELDPDAMSEIALMAETLSRMGLHTEAQLWINEMMRINPENQSIFRTQYVVLQHMNEWEQLAQLRDQWAPLVTGFSSRLERHGHLWKMQAEADRLWREKNTADSKPLYDEIINTLYEEIEILNENEAINTLSEQHRYGLILAHALSRMDRQEEAQGFLESIVLKASDKGDGLIDKAFALAMLNRTEETIQAFETSLKGAPSGEFGIHFFMNNELDWLNGLNNDPRILAVYQEFLAAREGRIQRLKVEIPQALNPTALLATARQNFL